MSKTEKAKGRKARRVRRAKRYATATLIVNNLIAGKQPTKAQLDAFKKTLIIDAEVVEDAKK
jgi:hypothetical protein